MNAPTMPRSPSGFPRAPLFGAAGLVVFALAAAMAGRIEGTATSRPVATPVASRDLLFHDRDDGAVAVYDAARPDTPIVVAVGQNGFLRGTLRGLARERRMEDIGSQKPFRVTQWNDGRFTLDDTATGRHIELAAFGATNEQVFADFLTAGKTAR